MRAVGRASRAVRAPAIAWFCPPLRPRQDGDKFFGFGSAPKPCAPQDLLEARLAQTPSTRSFVAFFKRSDKIPEGLSPWLLSRRLVLSLLGLLSASEQGQHSAAFRCALSPALSKTYSKCPQRKLKKSSSFVPLRRNKKGQNSSARANAVRLVHEKTCSKADRRKPPSTTGFVPIIAFSRARGQNSNSSSARPRAPCSLM